MCGKSKIEWTPEIDAALERAYNGSRGSLKRLAYELNIPRPSLSARAARIGLPRKKLSYPTRPWTPEEDDIVMEMAGLIVTKTKERLDAMGYTRSRRSIYARRDVLRSIGRIEAIPDDYGTSDLAAGFGCTVETICIWIKRGWLKAKAESDGPALYYRIKHSDLRKFVLEHTAAVSGVKPDIFWLVGIIRQ